METEEAGKIRAHQPGRNPTDLEGPRPPVPPGPLVEENRLGAETLESPKDCPAQKDRLPELPPKNSRNSTPLILI